MRGITYELSSLGYYLKDCSRVRHLLRLMEDPLELGIQEQKV